VNIRCKQPCFKPTTATDELNNRDRNILDCKTCEHGQKTWKLQRATGEGKSAAEAVEGSALALERVDDVHGGDSLASGVLGVGDGVVDDVPEEDLEHTAGLLIDEPGDALHAAPPRQPPDRRLGDALDVVAEHLPVTFAPPLPSPLPPLPRPDMAASCEFLRGGVGFGGEIVAAVEMVLGVGVGGSGGWI
jgi:hypothetical protein